MRPRPLLAIAVLVSVASPAPTLGQGYGPHDDPVIALVRAATARYQDRAAAEEDGYRRIGPDIPAMGEHWVQVELLLDPAVEVERPEILTYVPVDGRPRLVGVAWATALLGDEAPPLVPGVEGSWHAHDGPVEEELLQVGHADHGSGTEGRPGATTGTGSRVAVLHAWVWTSSPAGTYAAENWALPALRLGLSPADERDDEAARALSLARGGHAFLGRQVAVLAKLDEGVAGRASGILADAGTAVDAVILGAGSAGLGSGDRARLAAIWRSAREELSTTAGLERAGMIRDIFSAGSDPVTTDRLEPLPILERSGFRTQRACGHALRGAVIGGLAGAGLGIVVMSNANKRAMAIVATPLAMLGAGVGALIGSSRRKSDCEN
ncbi:hypothetical protein BH20GEM1_BH20GEM1_01340 [soil metagenome]